MKIRNKLYLVFSLFLILFAVVGFTIFKTNKQINESTRKAEITNNTSRNLNELNVLTYEYLLYHEKRMQQQWNTVYDSIFKLLEEEKARFNRTEEQFILKSIGTNLDTILDIFLELHAIHGKRQTLISGNALKLESASRSRLEAILTSQLLVKSHQASFDSMRLNAIAHQEVFETQREADYIIIISMSVFSVALLITGYFSFHSIATPISRLVEGADLIGKGKFDHKIDVKSRDEIGELAVSFNTMAGSLLNREEELQRIKWLLRKGFTPDTVKEGHEYRAPSYGDLTELNTARLVLDSVGKDILLDIVKGYLNLLDTSAAVYEKNGDYVLGIFTSKWCSFLDRNSRRICATEDNKEAIRSGKWVCHESCWTHASKVSIETGQPIDTECRGGIRLYAVPIYAGEEVVGSINFGYGDPPRDPGKLQELAGLYNVSVEELCKLAEEYESRPSFIIDIAKKNLQTSARLIGEIIKRNQNEKELEKHRERLDELVKKRTKELVEKSDNLEQSGKALTCLLEDVNEIRDNLTEANANLEEKNRELERFNKVFVEREFRIKELRDRIKKLEE